MCRGTARGPLRIQLSVVVVVDIVVIHVIVIEIRVHVGELAEAHLAADLHFFHIGVNMLLDMHGILNILQNNDGLGFVGRGNGDGTHAEQTLPQSAGNAQIPDAVQENFLILDVQKTHAEEQTVQTVRNG